MFCNYCGASNPDDASFCSICGKAIARPLPRATGSDESSQKITPAIPQNAATEVAKAKDPPVIASAERVRTLTGHTLPIDSLAFSPDGRWLASGSLDKTVRLWDVIQGGELKTFTGQFNFVCVEFSPDGRWLVMAAGGESQAGGSAAMGNSITLWDSTAPNALRNLAGHEGPVYFVKFSPDGRWLASTNGASQINLWDVASGKIVQRFKHGWFRSKFLGGTMGSSVAFSPDGRYLVTRSAPATLWDISSGKEARVFGPEPYSDFVSMFLRFTPDGQHLIQARGDGAIKIWDVPSGTLAHTLTDPPKQSGVTFRLRCATLNPEGNILAVSTYSSAEAFENQVKVTLWDISAGRTLGSMVASDCEALAFSPDGQWLAVGGMQYGGGIASGKIRLLRTSEIS